jgi:hypothetical protein
VADILAALQAAQQSSQAAARMTEDVLAFAALRVHKLALVNGPFCVQVRPCACRCALVRAGVRPCACRCAPLCVQVRPCACRVRARERLSLRLPLAGHRALLRAGERKKGRQSVTAARRREAL